LLLLHKKRESESVSSLICIIFAEDKLHSAKYSSKHDILRSFALSLQKINCTRQNIQASLIFCARLHYLCT